MVLFAELILYLVASLPATSALGSARTHATIQLRGTVSQSEGALGWSPTRVDGQLLFCNMYPVEAMANLTRKGRLVPDSEIAHQACEYVNDVHDQDVFQVYLHGVPTVLQDSFHVSSLPQGYGLPVVVLKKAGTEESPSMGFHAFVFPQSPVAHIAVIDAYDGNVSLPRLIVEDRAARPPSTEELQFDHIYTIDAGTYDISLMTRGGTKISKEEQLLPASTISISNGQNYAVMRVGGSSAVHPPELVIFRIEPDHVEELAGMVEREKSTGIGELTPGPVAIGISSAATAALVPLKNPVPTPRGNGTSVEATNMMLRHSDTASVQQPPETEEEMLAIDEQQHYDLTIVVLITIAVVLGVALVAASAYFEAMNAGPIYSEKAEEKTYAEHAAWAEKERRAREDDWAEEQRRAREEAYAEEQRQAREAAVHKQARMADREKREYEEEEQHANMVGAAPVGHEALRPLAKPPSLLGASAHADWGSRSFLHAEHPLYTRSAPAYHLAGSKGAF
eukprot:gnl/TRDRNA2_/TRDRNA2_154537_c0_seq4.p1 gnl/TRDRNA2_/TRDRNA2_154537_c0~~gnl/TRDRNA2_/TRDRNA2_154537_c0_seq4.p1  ORF type:complete len:508 (+),score=80.84 gnl/TRDRNA2_/TRDRNA2_154537_c0_seq4:65-1588(+)